MFLPPAFPQHRRRTDIVLATVGLVALLANARAEEAQTPMQEIVVEGSRNSQVGIANAAWSRKSSSRHGPSTAPANCSKPRRA
jgi:hypothetical protein